VCASHLQQIGQGIVVYASNYDDRCPEPLFATAAVPVHESTKTYLATIQDITGAPGKLVGGPFNLGHLLHERIIEEPKILYCPSAPKDFRYENYADRYDWRYDNTIGLTRAQVLAASYHYVPQSKRRETLDNDYTSYGPAFRLSQLNNRAPLALDVIDYDYFGSHRTVRKVSGMNILYGDGSVRFRMSTDKEKDLWQDSPGIRKGLFLDHSTFRALLYLFSE